MTLHIKVPGATFTGPRLITIDKIEPAQGALALYDFSNSLTTLSSSAVPAEGAILNNLMITQAQALTGATPADLNAIYHVQGMTGTLGKVERTPKGGLHVIESTTSTTSGNGMQFRIPKAGIPAYMKANPTHTFYFSQWGKPTRLASAQSLFASSSSDGTFAFILGTSGIGDYTVAGGGTGAGTVGTPIHRVIATTAYKAGYVTGVDSLAQNHAAFDLGNTRGVNTSGPGKHGAQVFYRFYAEDLTVSGRSFAEVQALDASLFTAEVLTAGGRYYGDTVPTDPATIP